MFHKHKHRRSQISGHSHHNHKLASEPFLAFKSSPGRGQWEEEDNPLFKTSSLLSLRTMKQHWDNIDMSPESENNKDVTTEMPDGLR